MPKEKNPTKATRSYGLGKKPKNLRFTPETIRKLRIAAHKDGTSETVYVEKALRNQFRKDGIE
jgi:hypothetical protein